MSIWCSWREIGFEHMGPRRWGRKEGGQVRTYANGWSNHYPTTDGKTERKASVGVASIPAWCVPGHRDETGDEVGPWLRLDMYTAEHDFFKPHKLAAGYTSPAVVMDEDAVRALVADLTDWLDRPKVHPALEAAS